MRNSFVKIASFEATARSLVVTWDDQADSEFPFIWLRDNDVAELHPTTRERIFDLTTVPIDIQPLESRLEDRRLIVQWPDRDTPSIYQADWLHRHRPGFMRVDPSMVEQSLWDAAAIPRIPRFDAAACRSEPATLLEALREVKSMGIVIFDKLSDDASAGENFADLIGFKRETNFGVMFDVISKPDPNNLAYTSDALPLHIDLTNQELVPGYQFLHCVVNDAMGGQSVFADGYKICADLQSADPESFERLKKIEIPCRFHDAICDIRYRRPVISQDANGDFSQLVFNAHIADVPDMPADELCEFYEAYQQLMRLAREPEYAINHQLKAGEMVMFDNRRVMHGRAAFDTAAGTRHLRGFYIDRNEVDSRIRVLSRG